MHRMMLVSLLLIGIIAAGCSSSYRTESEQPEKTPLVKKYSAEIKIADTIDNQKDTIEVLTLDKAVVIALANNPELVSYNLEIKALESVALQQGLSPNPELGVETENIFGSNNFTGFNSSETTLLLSQDILLAGKLNKQRRVAVLESDIAGWEYERKRLDLITNVRLVFIQAITLQRDINLTKELLKISNEFLSNINKRIEAGKVSPAEASRAKVIVSSLEISLTNYELSYRSVKRQLRALLGTDKYIFKEVSGKLKIIDVLPDFELLQEKLFQSPELAKYDKVFERQEAIIELEASKSVPDLNIAVGWRWLNETSDNAFVLGASIPLPIYNRNQGSLQEAKIRFDQKKSELLSDKNNLMSDYNTTYNNLISLSEALKKLNEESIPDAQNAFEIIRDGNLVGRFTILDVLDSQRTLFELQSEYLRTLQNYNIQLARLERLIGQNIENIK
ncbi:cobalt-zinc-cadmium resistance protein CzcC precursor [bacterium BMS3Abin03]|nr:cobalt-zinc-cadmium resistance protein CzcC precursor [bacterium BMS3Abin03]